MSSHNNSANKGTVLYITCIRGESKFLKFWAHVPNVLDKIKNLEKQLMEDSLELDSMPGFLSNRDLALGAKCCVKTKTKRWYRGMIASYTSDPCQVFVKLLDYGNYELVRVSDVRKVDELRYFSLTQPDYATECILADVVPYTKEWPPEAIEFCKQHLLHKEFYGYPVTHFRGLPIVRLAKIGENRPFAQLLVDNRLASIETTEPPPPQLHHLARVYGGDTFRAVPLNFNSHNNLVLVSYVESPQKFYIQPAYKEKELKFLMERIQIWAETECSDMINEPLIGTPCITQYSGDEIYYRAVITSVSHGSCRVLFVDYGNCETKMLQELKAIPQNFITHLDAQAWECTLHMPDGVDSEAFRFATKGKYFTCNALGFVKHVCVVTLMDNGKDLATELSSKPVNPLPNFVPFNQIQLAVDSTYEVEVSYVFSPVEFYCQLTEKKPEIDLITSKLQSTYSHNNDLYQIKFEECIVGSPVCVKFSEDGNWYRAKIMQAENLNNIQVTYVDYGNSEITAIHNIRKLVYDLLKIPIQAFKFSLYGIEHISSTVLTSDEFVTVFENLTSDKLAAKITSSAETSYTVNLYNVQSTQNVFINEKICQLGISKTKLSNCPLSKVENIYVTSFTLPSLFFGQLSRFESSELDELQAQINAFYSVLSKDSFEPCVNDFVCAKFSEDNQYYRAKIEARSEKTYDVIFVDYGNRETVNESNIHKMHSKFAKLPIFGIECALAKYPLTVPVHKLQNLMLENEIQVEMISENAGKWQVALTENWIGNAPILEFLRQSEMISVPISKGGEYLREVAKKDLKEDVDNWQTDPNTSFNSSDFQPSCENNQFVDNSEKMQSRRNRNDFPKSRPPASRGSSNDEDRDTSWKSTRNDRQVSNERARRDERYSRNPNDTYKSEPRQRHKNLDCTLPEESFQKEPFKSFEKNTESKNRTDHDPELQVLSSSVSKPLPTINLTNYKHVEVPNGAYRDVYVTHVISPSEFYCQIREEHSKLLTVMDKIADVYGNINNNDLQFDKLELGLPCCAVFSEDSTWYRGKIIGITAINKPTAIEVCFVDYGNSEKISVSKVKMLKPEFLCLPPQALKCALFNTLPQETAWSIDDVSTFVEMTKEKCFVAQFVKLEANESYLINLVNVDKMQNDVLNKKFVDSGHGRLVDANNLLKRNLHSVSPNLILTDPVIAIGSTEKVIVTWVKNPHDFYCQLKSLAPEFQKTMNEMQKHYTQIADIEGVIDRPHPGMMCVAQFTEDSAWYRAQILHVKGNLVGVYYVDYGNSEEVIRKRVKYIIQDFTQQSIQCVKCHLRGAKPDGSWPLLSEEIGTKYFEGEMLCTFIDNCDDYFIVDLFRHSGKSIAKEMITNQFALPDANFTPADLDIEHDQPIAPENLLCFKVGHLINVIISFIESPHRFWCQQQNDTEQLDELMAAIESYYTSISSNEREFSNLAVGCSCIAKFSEDERWYRAVVKSMPSPHQIEVMFIDYGNSETVEKSQVKEICPEFFELPSQAFECKLYGAPQTYCDEMAEKFEALVDETELMAKVESTEDSTLVVTLYDMSGPNEVNLLESIFGITELDTSAQFKGSSNSFLPVEVPIGEHTGFISAMKNPSDFYIQLSEKETELTDLTVNLTEKYQTLTDTDDQLPELFVGTSCCAQYSEDNVWYRAIITDIQGDAVSVMFIDYGNSDVVTTSSLKILHQEFLEKPPFAIKCKLAGVKPFGEEWSEETIETFNAFTEDMSITVTFMDSLQPALVCLQINGASLTRKLIDIQLAMSDVSNEKFEEHDHLCEDTTIQDFLDIPAALCNIPVTETKSTSDTPAIRYPERVFDGLKFTVKLSYVESIDKFYVTPVEWNDRLESTTAKLEKLYSSSSASSMLLSDTQLLHPCAAKYSEDETWYRAVVLQIGDHTASVLFVDYGNCETTVEQNLKELVPELLEEPPLAIECSLYGVQAFEEKQTEVTSKLEEFMDEELEMEIMDAQKPYKVKIKGESDISELLIKEGFAAAHIPSSHRLQDSEAFKENLRIAFVDELPEEDKVIIPHRQILQNDIIGTVKHSEVLDDLVVFYIVPTNLEDALAIQQDKLQDVYNAVQKNITSPKEGDFCVAKYSEDDCWYRAQVKKTNGEIVVKFVDYGNSETIAENCICELTPEFLTEKLFSLCCCLSGVKAIKGNEEVMHAKIEELTEEQELTLHVYGPILGYPELYRVRALVDGADVAELMLQDDMLIQVYPFHHRLDKEFRATVEHVETDCNFYVIPFEWIEKRNSLQAELQTLCEKAECDTLVDISSHCLYAVRDKGLWFRASIECCTDDTITVNYVDFGFSNNVTDKSDLQKLPSEFCHEPPLVFHCTLHSLSHSTNEIKEIFEKATYDKIVTCKVETVHYNQLPLRVSLSIDGSDILPYLNSAEELLDIDANVETSDFSLAPQEMDSVNDELGNSCISPNETSVDFDQADQNNESLLEEFVSGDEMEGREVNAEDSCERDSVSSASLTYDDASVQEDQNKITYKSEDDTYLLKDQKSDDKHFIEDPVNVKTQEVNMENLCEDLSHNELEENMITETLNSASNDSEIIDHDQKQAIAEDDAKSVPQSNSMNSLQETDNADFLSAQGSANVDYTEELSSEMQKEEAGLYEDSNFSDNELEENVTKGEQLNNSSESEIIDTCSQNDSVSLQEERSSNALESENFDIELTENKRPGETREQYSSHVPNIEDSDESINLLDIKCDTVENTPETDENATNMYTIQNKVTDVSPEQLSDPKFAYDGEWEENFNDETSDSDNEYQIEFDSSLSFENTDETDNLKPHYPERQLSSGIMSVSVSHIAVSKGSILLAVMPHEIEEQLADLQNRLQNAYREEKEIDMFSKEERVLSCAVKSTDDCWYRGKVLHVNGNSLTALLVDYGSSATVDITSVRTLTPEFIKDPPFSVWCVLCGVTCVDSKTSTVESGLKGLLENEKVTVEIFNEREPYNVKLTIDNNDVIEQLLSEQLVIQCLPEHDVIDEECLATVSEFNPGKAGQFEFYVNLSLEMDKLKDLNRRIQLRYENKSKDINPVTEIYEYGLYAVCFKGAWYRCSVIFVSGNSVTVKLVDKGNCMSIDKQSLEPLFTEFCLEPPFAVLCYIKNIRVTVNQRPNVSQIIKDIIETKEFSLDFRGRLKDIYDVSMTGENHAFIEELYKENYIYYLPKVLSCYSELAVPLDTETEIIVTWFTSIESFFVRLAIHENELEEMEKQLHDFYELKDTESEYTLKKPAKQKVCAGFCSKFNRWCRAKITDITEDLITVYFVDSGILETTTKSYLRLLDPYFLFLPSQVVFCALDFDSSVSTSSCPIEDTVFDEGTHLKCKLSLGSYNKEYNVTLLKAVSNETSDRINSSVEAENSQSMDGEKTANDTLRPVDDNASESSENKISNSSDYDHASFQNSDEFNKTNFPISLSNSEDIKPQLTRDSACVEDKIEPDCSQLSNLPEEASSPVGLDTDPSALITEELSESFENTDENEILVESEARPSPVQSATLQQEASTSDRINSSVEAENSQSMDGEKTANDTLRPVDDNASESSEHKNKISNSSDYDHASFQNSDEFNKTNFPISLSNSEDIKPQLTCDSACVEDKIEPDSSQLSNLPEEAASPVGLDTDPSALITEELSESFENTDENEILGESEARPSPVQSATLQQEASFSSDSQEDEFFISSDDSARDLSQQQIGKKNPEKCTEHCVQNEQLVGFLKESFSLTASSEANDTKEKVTPSVSS